MGVYDPEEEEQEEDQEGPDINGISAARDVRLPNIKRNKYSLAISSLDEDASYLATSAEAHSAVKLLFPGTSRPAGEKPTPQRSTYATPPTPAASAPLLPAAAGSTWTPSRHDVNA